MRRYIRNKAEQGALMMEVILMIAILLAVFPVVQRNARRRADDLRNQYVIKDMTRLRSSLENFIDQRIHTFDFADGDIMEFSGEELGILSDTGLPKGFRYRNILGQDYMVKIRRHQPRPDAPYEYDAIVVAQGNPEIPDVRLREIAKESRGFGGYVEDGVIYGQNWSFDTSVWVGRHPIGPDAIVFTTGFSRRDYQYISRVNERYAVMKTGLDMNLNNIYGVDKVELGAAADVNKLRATASSATTVDTMNILTEATFRGQITAGSVIFTNGIEKAGLNIESRRLREVFLETMLNVRGNMRALANDMTNRLQNVYAESVVANGQKLEILVQNLLSVPQVVPFKVGFMRFGTMSVDARNMMDGIGGRTPTGITFATMRSEVDAKYRIDGTGFAGHDVIVRNLNDRLRGQKIGGIDITSRTPLSVILRGLAYEYADIYRLVHNEYPKRDDPPIADARWSLGILYRCTEEYCDPARFPYWDLGL